MTTANNDLNAAIDAIADQQEAALAEQFPQLSMTLANRFYVDPDPDGHTFWLRDLARVIEDQPFGGQAAALEARHVAIMQHLQEAARRVNAYNSTKR